MYCPYCGTQLSDGVNYCPNCGAPVTAVSTTSITANKADGDYRLILLSRGTCTKTQTVELLEDLLGYTSSLAAQLYASMPVEIAEGLTESQARFLAQAFAEYGISVSVYDQYDEYVDLQAASDTSIFNSDGSLITAALTVLAGITAVNRVNSLRRYKKPGLLERIFRLAFTPKKKPVHVRRSIYRPAPRPAARRANPPQMQIIRKPERRKTANPAGSHRPQGSTHSAHQPKKGRR